MNASNAKDYLPLVQALADGKVIQFCNGVGDWQDINCRLDFLLPPANYRIKPEPKEIWVNVAGRLGNCFFESEDEALAHAKRYSIEASLIRYREVIE